MCVSPSGDRESEKPASSEQVEELQTQTTNLGLQLHREFDDNTGIVVIVWRSHTHERKQREGLVSCFTSVCTTPAGFLQSNQIAELVTRHASCSTPPPPPPRITLAKQPTWTFEPEANVNAYDCTSSNVRNL